MDQLIVKEHAAAQQYFFKKIYVYTPSSVGTTVVRELQFDVSTCHIRLEGFMMSPPSKLC